MNTPKLTTASMPRRISDVAGTAVPTRALAS
jgi:hypothetical protein